MNKSRLCKVWVVNDENGSLLSVHATLREAEADLAIRASKSKKLFQIGSWGVSCASSDLPHEDRESELLAKIDQISAERDEAIKVAEGLVSAEIWVVTWRDGMREAFTKKTEADKLFGRGARPVPLDEQPVKMESVALHGVFISADAGEEERMSDERKCETCESLEEENAKLRRGMQSYIDRTDAAEDRAEAAESEIASEREGKPKLYIGDDETDVYIGDGKANVFTPKYDKRLQYLTARVEQCEAAIKMFGEKMGR